MFGVSQESVLDVMGQHVSISSILLRIHRQGKLASLLVEVAKSELVERQAQRLGIMLTDQELQQAADRFRLRHALTSAEETDRWLRERNWSAFDFQAAIEHELLHQKLSDAATHDEVEQYFKNHVEAFDKFRLQQIVAASEDAALELKQQIKQDGADFADLARMHSLVSPFSAGIEPWDVFRHQLPLVVAELVSSASVGSIVGPVSGDRGFHLFKIEGHVPGVLDGHTTTTIKELLFDQWLQEQLNSVRFNLNFLSTSDERN